MVNYLTLDEEIAPSSLNHPCVQKIDTKPHSEGWISSLGEKTQVSTSFNNNNVQVNNMCPIISKDDPKFAYYTGVIVQKMLDNQCNITEDVFYCKNKTMPLFRHARIKLTLLVSERITQIISTRLI
jgi:hypothetical protein